MSGVGYEVDAKKAYSVETVSLFYGLVGTAGFELATPCTPCKCATRLRYAPRAGIIAVFYCKAKRMAYNAAVELWSGCVVVVLLLP